MSDHDFLLAARVKNFPIDESSRAVKRSLTEALRIDDGRSVYCEMLEARIEAQAAAIKAVRDLLWPESTAGG